MEENFAPTDVSAPMVTTHVVEVPTHAPVQLANTKPGCACATSVTAAPWVATTLQLLEPAPQPMPAAPAHVQPKLAAAEPSGANATLVELGYLSNPQDEKLLTVRQHQMALARALRASVDAYFGPNSVPGAATRKA